MKCPGSPQSRAEVVIQAISTPKYSFPTLEVDQIRSIGRLQTAFPMDSYGKNKAGGRPKQTPTVIYSRTREKVEALAKSGLHARETDFSGF